MKGRSKKHRDRAEHLSGLLLEAVWDIKEAILGSMNAENLHYFFDDDSRALRPVMSDRVMVFLAVLSDHLSIIVTSAVQCNNYLLVQPFEGFLNEAHTYYSEHLKGYERDGNGVPFDSFTFGLSFFHNTEPFGGRNSLTKSLARRMMICVDAFSSKPCLISKYLSTRQKAISELLSDPSISSEKRLHILDTLRLDGERLLGAGKNFPESLKESEASASNELTTVCSTANDLARSNSEHAGSIQPQASRTRLLVATVDEQSWLNCVSDAPAQQIMLRIFRYGSISESDLEDLTGSPRRARAFLTQLDQMRRLLPFQVEIDTSSGSRYFRRA